ncbi:MAG: hypothetical protein RL330_618 [Actinomycetota bacterium]|jgi:hypothetical protein
MPRRLPPALGATVLVVAAWAGLAAADDGTTVPSDTSPDATFVYDLENEPSECIGFLPRPGCGKAPQQAGDRGGALQYAVFGVLMAGLGTIGTVLVRNVVRRDRAMNASLSGDDPGRDRA